MNEKFPLASTAALIADPARAAMLASLLDARPRSAGELASVANTSAQSASMHLAQLLAGGFLIVAQQGRHRYYSIANHRVAHAIEALGIISMAPGFKPSVNDRDLRFARTWHIGSPRACPELAGRVSILRSGTSARPTHLAN